LNPDALRWNERYQDETERWALRSPRPLVTSHIELLPKGALILDAACGTTSTGRHLASLGWHVIAVDVSLVALQFARARVRDERLPISFADMDLMNPWLPAAWFDVILNLYFLSRPLWEHYRTALKPGGLLFFETYLREKGANPARYLESQELRRAFQDWEILHYLEVEREVHSHSGVQGTRWSAQLIARKPQ